MAPQTSTDPHDHLDGRPRAVPGVDESTGEILGVATDEGWPEDDLGRAGGVVVELPVVPFTVPDGAVVIDDQIVLAPSELEHDAEAEIDDGGVGDIDADVGPDDAGGGPADRVAVAGFGQDVLNPAQLEVVAMLGAKPSERPEFDAELRHHLRAELEAGLEPLLDLVPEGETLFVSKYPLSQIHGCEDRFLADRREAFAWSPSKVRGSVSHKAVELSLHWESDPVPLELVDEAMARLTFGSGSLADWLQAATPVERAEVRAQANERVAMFLECFPPLKKAWRPVTESPVRLELFESRIVLSGRVDLTLGKPQGTTANKVLIDFKSGRFLPSHVDDLRFYALLETIRMGTPPRMLATYYLDSGRPFPEAVSEPVLEVALHRTIDGATRMAHLLHSDAAPVRRTGPSCRWCPMLSSCDDGQAHLRAADDADVLATADDG